MRGVAVCRRLSPYAGASVLTIARFSLRLAAPRFRRHLLNSDGYPRQSLFRSSITRLSHSLSTLRSFPSRSRGRTATQDSLPAGGQPLPGGGHDPARSQMKFQSLPSSYTTSSSSKLRNAINVRVGLRLTFPAPKTREPSLRQDGSASLARQGALARHCRGPRRSRVHPGKPRRRTNPFEHKPEPTRSNAHRPREPYG